jgi:hypothetical protein
MKQSSRAAPWLTTRRARTRSILHQTLNGFFLRDLGEERIPFCILTTVKTDHGKLVTGRRLGSSATATATTSGSASAPGMAPAVAVVAGTPPPSNELAREAPVRRHNGGGLVGNGARSQVKFAWGMALFIGETHLLVEDAEAILIYL